MGVTRRKDRSGWWVRFEINGKYVQRYGGPCKRDALKYESQIKVEFTPAPEHDLNRFVEEIYWPAQLNHLSDEAEKREWSILKNHIGPFFDGPMNQISPQRVLKYIGDRKAKGAGSGTIQREIATLRHILRKAMRLDFILKNPLDKLDSADVPKASPARTRYLTTEEWQKLLFQIPEQYVLFFLFLINTGCRRGEALRLEHSDLDLTQGVARVGRDKRGKPKVIPLAPFLVKMLKQRPLLEGDPRVFCLSRWGQTFSRVFRSACRRAGIQNCRLHDLRHSFASQLVMHGVDLRTVQDLLGHEDPRQTARYAHLSPEHLAASIDAMKGVYKGRVN